MIQTVGQQLLLLRLKFKLYNTKMCPEIFTISGLGALNWLQVWAGPAMDRQRSPDLDQWAFIEVRMNHNIRQQMYFWPPVLKVQNVTLLNFCTAWRRGCTPFLLSLLGEASIHPPGKERHSKQGHKNKGNHYIILSLWGGKWQAKSSTGPLCIPVFKQKEFEKFPVTEKKLKHGVAMTPKLQLPV